MNPILCIDPGASGGLALLNHESIIAAFPMPEGMTAQIDAIRAMAVANPGLVAVMEKVGFHRPGNSAVASCKFARHVGHLEAALYTCGIPFVEVTPHKWMAAIGKMPADKKARKNAIKEEMARRFPHLMVTLGVADALGILCWARNQS
ncbi:MAG: hypothetical protein BWX69_03166 [Planctomycetes bacterium ADurb.Bin069]|nr:MAG: hypothetical protein BWX69_03166 [Planctomycetes bacterium ADurb.Bin069]